MSRVYHALAFTSLALLLGVLVRTPSSRAADVGYVEDFALAKDRAAALKQLIPGSEDYFYYHALHYLNLGQFEKIDALAKPWHEAYGQSARLTEIQNRRALLTFDKDPAKSLTYLRTHLNLYYNHEKEVLGAIPNLPGTLDAKLIARDTLRKSSLARWGNLDNFESLALDGMANEKLTMEQRRQLLSRLERPDVANLPKLISADMRSKDSSPFGSMKIHGLLTKAQLEELLKLQPELLNHTPYVNAYIAKLHPGADDDWKRDKALAQAYLERLQAFVDTLAPVFNPLKAHVLYHRLALDRSKGEFNKKRFLEYLKLPRQQGYMARKMNENDKLNFHPAYLQANFPITLLPPVGNDEPLVRSFLAQHLVEAKDIGEFLPYIDDVYLQHLFAETKLVNGLGNPETWAKLLPPEQLKQLKERVDIDFAFTNATDFGVDEPIKMQLFVKNAGNLLMKVYEVNTRHFYRTTGREIDTDFNIDGLIPNAERTIPGNADPFRRTAVTIELPGEGVNFPEANTPGVFIVDLIGGGRSSRALVRKGRLHPIVTTGTAGQVIRVVDEKNKPVNDATAWIGGQEYAAEKDGRILVPFSTAPGRKPIVLSRGNFACLESFDHAAENYSLAVGIHIDRESLISQQIAPVLIRPQLSLNGVPVSIGLLEDVRLQIVSKDLDGVPTSVEVPNFKLFEDRETIHDIRVPARLASIQVTLLAKVKSLSTDKKIDLAASRSFSLNGIDKTERIEDIHLAKIGADTKLELLGRTGEAKADKAVNLTLKHREFKEPVHVSLKTDAAGRINLGLLTDITHVTAQIPDGTTRTWNLLHDQHSYRQLIHAKAGEVVAVPYMGHAAAPSREELALFEVVGDTIRADSFNTLKIRNGLIEIAGLAPGDYDLWLKLTGERLRIRIAAGVVENNTLLGRMRQLELPGLPAVQIESIDLAGDTVKVKLKDSSKFARVHIFATRYQPEYNAFHDLAVPMGELRAGAATRAENVYLTGRNIGDEYRYVLERRTQKKYPGNMLERPALLLNPWAVRVTETGEQVAQGGDKFGATGGGVNKPQPPAAPLPDLPFAAERMTDKYETAPTATPDLDFLFEGTAIAVNQIADKDGVVSLPKKNFGPHAQFHVIAVDPLNTTYRTVTIPEQPASFADLRLKNGLDPAKHFTQQKLVTILEANKPFEIADVAASRFETYDSLAKVYALYATLSKDPKLAEFAFVLRWPTLKPEEKRKYYSDFACHELSFFLSKKDPEFFTAVVKPYLANKKDKTFLDQWLLGSDLQRFLQPWEYSRLNVPERVLLAQRIANEPGKTARHLNDLLKLIPPDVNRDGYLFDVAVNARSLANPNDDAAGIKPEIARLEARLKEQKGIKAEKEEMFYQSLGTVTPAPAVRSSMPAGGGGGRGGATKDGRGEEKEAAKKMQDKVEESLNQNELSPPGFGPDKADNFFDNDRKAVLSRAFYRKVDPTTEWAENNYYKLLITQQLADLVPVNSFWADYSKYNGEGGFLSKHLPAASRNFTEMMLALAVLDLPFEPGKHVAKFDAGKMTLTPGNRIIAFHEEVRPAEGAGGQVPLLVSQNFYRQGDRFRDENGEKVDKFVTGEFVVFTVYGCQLVVTNPTSSRQKLQVLLQLPVGAIPVGNGKATKSVNLDLQPYHTQTIDYFFYFPQPGKFTQLPVQVAKEEKFVTAAAAATFDVLAKPSKPDTGSWEYVSQNGTNDDVLNFLNRENVRALNLEKIAFRMKDRGFFETVTKLLAERHLYQNTLWSYGLLHADNATAQEFLKHQDGFINSTGPIRSTLLTIDPVERHQYEHLEYKPLVNARAHALGHRRQIVNNRFAEQYHRLLKTLSYQATLDDTDVLATVYYLLLQDRIEKATEAFERVKRDTVTTKMQYDYYACYLEMFNDDPKKARSIAAPYANHPIDRWRNTFAAVIATLDEIEGKGGKVVDAENRDQQQGQLAATEPAFEFTVDTKAMNLTWQNLDAVTVNYFPMDVELLFSSNPFVSQGSNQFASIRPNASKVVQLPKDAKTLSVPIPPEFASKNVLIEVTAAGKSRAVPYYATAMTVGFTENYGQLKVTDTAAGKALGKVYVKVYAKLANGQVKFHKDGYTDLRGRFDYVSVNTPERTAIERFSVLVLSEDKGAMIREAAPPAK